MFIQKLKNGAGKKELLLSAKKKNNTGSGSVQVQYLWNFSQTSYISVTYIMSP